VSRTVAKLSVGSVSGCPFFDAVQLGLVRSGHKTGPRSRGGRKGNVAVSVRAYALNGQDGTCLTAISPASFSGDRAGVPVVSVTKHEQAVVLRGQNEVGFSVDGLSIRGTDRYWTRALIFENVRTSRSRLCIRENVFVRAVPSEDYILVAVRPMIEGKEGHLLLMSPKVVIFLLGVIVTHIF